MQKYMPYSVDLKYQYRTYKHIGKLYQIEFMAEKNCIYKLLRKSESFFNKKEKKYKNFATFSQWESYIRNEFDKIRFVNKWDYIHYLERNKRICEMLYNMIGAIVTPIYVVMLTFGITFMSNTSGMDNFDEITVYLLKVFVFMTIILLFMTIYLVQRFCKLRKKQSFYEDLIVIIKNNI